MKILITGGHGFVGSALTKALHERYPHAQLFVPSSRELDLLDAQGTGAYIKETAPDVVYHLAARLGGVGLVSGRPLAFLEDNLQINLNLVRAVRENSGGYSKLITLGSSCCYSENAPLPNRESDLWNGRPENTYGICKLVLLEQLANQREKNWAYLIPPNIYGPGDHFGDENAHFIPATVRKLQEAVEDGTNEIEVWGDGSQTRDFVYIDDIVHFLLAALEDERYAGRPVNIGTGIEVSVKDITLAIREILGLSETVAVRWAPDKPTGTIRKALSNETLRTLAPDYAFVGIDIGLRETLKAWT